MKKKILPLIVALAMPLAGCSFKDLLFWKKDKKEEQPQGLTEEQKVQSARIQELIYPYVEDEFGEEIAVATKPFIVTYSDEAAAHDANAGKLQVYVPRFETVLDDGDPLYVLDTLGEFKDDEALDDMLYFGLALGKSMCTAATLNDPTIAQTCNTALTLVANEGEAFASNALAVVDKVVVSYNKLSTSKFLEAAQGIVDVDTEKIDTENLKYVFGEASKVLKDSLSIKENVKYLTNFAVKLFNGIAPTVEEIPEFVPGLVELFNFSAIVEDGFRVAENFADALGNLGEDYYSYIDSIENTEESYLYLILGLIDEAADKKALTEAQIKNAVESLIKVAGKVYEIVADMEEDVPELVGDIIASENTKEILIKLVTLGSEIAATKLTSFGPKEIAKMLSYVIGETYDYDSTCTSYWNIEDLPENLKAIIGYDEIMANVNAHIDFNYKDIDYLDFGAPVFNEELGVYEFKCLSVHYSASYKYEEYLDDYVSFSLYCYDYDVSYRPYEPLAQALAGIVAELAETEEITDKFVEGVLGIAASVKDLFEELEIDFGENSEMVHGILDIITTMDDEAIELAKKVANDLFIALDNMMEAFVGEGAYIDLGYLVVCKDKFKELVFTGFAAENLVGLHLLCEDAYALFAKFDAVETLTGLVASLLRDNTIAEAATATAFADAVCGALAI